MNPPKRQKVVKTGPAKPSSSEESGRIREERYKIALWISEGKSKRLNLQELGQYFSNNNMELILADVRKPISEQGPFAMVIYKIVELIIKNDQEILEDFEDYIKKHPEMVVMDPVTSLRRIVNRCEQYSLIQQCVSGTEGAARVPSFVSLTENDPIVNIEKLKSAGAGFLFVSKPLMADGTNKAHKMALIFNKHGLKNISPHVLPKHL